MIVNPTCSHRKFAFDSQHLSWRRKLWPARACKQLVDGGHFLIKCIESHGEVAARGQGRGLLRRTAALRCCITAFDRKVRWQKQPPAAPLGNLDQKIRGDGPLQQLDRKSVVWGKSVYVRVDIGSSRILTKKNNQ